MYLPKDKRTPKDNEKVFGRFSMRTEKSIGEPHSKMVSGMEFRRSLMNRETSQKPVYGKTEN